MAFQEQVNRYRAKGIAGQAATPDQSIYTAKNYLSDGTVTIGCFAWESSSDSKQATGSGSGIPLGLVERNIIYPIMDVSKTAQDTAPEGYGVTIAVRGDYYVEVSGAASVGQALFAKTADGTIVPGTPGGTVASAVETPWLIKDALEAGTSGGLVLASNWGITPAATGGSAGTVNLANATGILAVANGGTGASTAENARTTLGLGTIATQNSPLPVANGGTGAADAANARTNLGAAAAE